MGLFGNQSEHTKDEYGFNSSNLTADEIKMMKQVFSKLNVTGLLDFSQKISYDAKAMDRIKIDYLQAIFQQNMLMIHQLSRIAKALEK